MILNVENDKELTINISCSKCQTILKVTSCDRLPSMEDIYIDVEPCPKCSKEHIVFIQKENKMIIDVENYKEIDVYITCDKCGNTLTILQTGFKLNRNDAGKFRFIVSPCPKCSKDD